MERRVVIRGWWLGDWGLPVTLGVLVPVFALLAVVTQISSHRFALIRWLFLLVLSVLTTVVFEAISRRNFVEAADGRVRWASRQPRDKGEKALANLLRVEVYRGAGARLVFRDGDVVMPEVSDFRRRDISRLVEALRAMGVAVSEPA